MGAPLAGAPLQPLLSVESPDMLVVLTAEGRHQIVSGGCTHLLGLQAEELVGSLQDDLAHPDDLPTLLTARGTAMAGGQTVTCAARLRTHSGAFRWVEATLRRAPGTELLVGSIRDLHERRASEDDLRVLATTDGLTGLSNRRVLMDRLQHSIERLGRAPGHVGLLFLDLDRFKVINDSCGHATGDRVLSALAGRLHAVTRPADTIARLGGDEFAVLMEDISRPEDLTDLAERLTEACRKPFEFDGQSFVCTVSVGVAVTSDAGHSADALLQEADLALYRAKDGGRNQVAQFDDSLRTRALSRLATERLLRRALAHDGLRLAQQAIVDLGSGTPVGVEALVRIRDPVGRIWVPDDFLTVAEEAGLLGRIDDWVLNAVFREARLRNPDGLAGQGFVSFNLTARRFADASFVPALVRRLADASLAPGAIGVEVTERALIEASNSAMTGLAEMRAAGLHVALDDFGTGYSSLAYLRQFPLDSVKLDGLFVTDLDTDPLARAVLAAVVDLGHALGLTVVAEGVETTEQLGVLRDLRCDYGQGYLFGAPTIQEAGG